MKYKLSVIICTMNRASDLLDAVHSVKSQSLLPNELLIIDDGNLNSKFLNRIKSICPFEIFYYRKENEKQGLTISRNIGIRYASGDILFFIDDDIVLDKDYIKSIYELYKKDKGCSIGGIGGVIKIDNPGIFNLGIRKLFFLSAPKAGEELYYWGFKLKNICKGEFCKVDFLLGVASYRKEVFKYEMFDEIYNVYATGEDFDFSYRVGQRFSLLNARNARFYHKEHEGSIYRGVNYRSIYSKIINRYYMMIKSENNNPINTFTFYYGIFGLFLFSIIKNFRTDKLNSFRRFKSIIRAHFDSFLFTYYVNDLEVVKKKIKSLQYH